MRVPARRPCGKPQGRDEARELSACRRRHRVTVNCWIRPGVPGFTTEQARELLARVVGRHWTAEADQAVEAAAEILVPCNALPLAIRIVGRREHLAYPMQMSALGVLGSTGAGVGVPGLRDRPGSRSAGVGPRRSFASRGTLVKRPVGQVPATAPERERQGELGAA